MNNEERSVTNDQHESGGAPPAAVDAPSNEGKAADAGTQAAGGAPQPGRNNEGDSSSGEGRRRRRRRGRRGGRRGGGENSGQNGGQSRRSGSGDKGKSSRSRRGGRRGSGGGEANGNVGSRRGNHQKGEADGNIAFGGGAGDEIDGNLAANDPDTEQSEVNGNRVIHENEIWESLVGTPHHKGHLPPDDPFWQFGSPVELWGSTMGLHHRNQPKGDGKKKKNNGKSGRRRGGKNRRRGGRGHGRNSTPAS